MRKSNKRINEENLLIEYGLLDGKELYNPRTNRYIQATGSNITRLYNELVEEIKEPEQPQPQRVNLEELIRDGRRQLIELKLNDGTSEQFMLNANTIEQINKLINEGYREKEQKEYGSDTIFRANYIGITSYEIKEIMADHKIENKDGSFFNFINTSKLDLTKYQILREEDDEKIIEEQCLLYTLKLQGINESLINNIKLRSLTKGILK